eukprot:CAMPEP_0114271770 /NCGR_PEP_ID=MMETSP0058-20121206/28043_1 /TAXON_ID=36894 /ORGANISM="Pyramimonas parkeae, CCMP726" /LENGTH=128 /DNA_ID=CAMNT_0001390785 /DNA_START=27 /DNA_END=413 /DNA_ORIENTATION=+
MCVGGMPEPQSDHALRVARFALDAVRAANSEVVASVMGDLNPRYCLFGDTVTTAAKMEAHSERNCINISIQAKKALDDQCPGISTTPRGLINIETRNVECFFLDQTRENYQVARVTGQAARMKLLETV